jgi:hypothetical protein
MRLVRPLPPEVNRMPDAFGRLTPEEQLKGFLQLLNIVGSVAKGTDTLNRSIARERDPWDTLGDLLQQLGEAANRAQSIENLRLPPPPLLPR